MPATSMDQLVSLCKRRGFIFQNADIYGGLQGGLRLRSAGRGTEEQPQGRVVAGDGLRTRRRGRA